MCTVRLPWVTGSTIGVMEPLQSSNDAGRRSSRGRHRHTPVMTPRPQRRSLVCLGCSTSSRLFYLPTSHGTAGASKIGNIGTLGSGWVRPAMALTTGSARKDPTECSAAKLFAIVAEPLLASACARECKFQARKGKQMSVDPGTVGQCGRGCDRLPIGGWGRGRGNVVPSPVCRSTSLLSATATTHCI